MANLPPIQVKVNKSSVHMSESCRGMQDDQRCGAGEHPGTIAAIVPPPSAGLETADSVSEAPSSASMDDAVPSRPGSLSNIGKMHGVHSSIEPKIGRIFVGRLRPGIDSQQLEEALTPFGRVLRAKVVSNSSKGRVKGFAFCEMESEEAAEAAIQGLHGTTELGAPQLIVSHTVERNNSCDTPNSSASFASFGSYGSFATNPANYGLAWTPSSNASRMSMPLSGPLPPLPLPHQHAGMPYHWQQQQHHAMHMRLTHDRNGEPLTTTLYVRPLPEEMDEYGVWNLFMLFGVVVATKILRNGDGSSRRAGFVEYSSRGEAEHAMAVMSSPAAPGGRMRVSWGERPLHVSVANGAGGLCTMSQPQQAYRGGYTSSPPLHQPSWMPHAPPPPPHPHHGQWQLPPMASQGPVPTYIPHVPRRASPSYMTAPPTMQSGSKFTGMPSGMHDAAGLSQNDSPPRCSWDPVTVWAAALSPENLARRRGGAKMQGSPPAGGVRVARGGMGRRAASSSRFPGGPNDSAPSTPQTTMSLGQRSNDSLIMRSAPPPSSLSPSDMDAIRSRVLAAANSIRTGIPRSPLSSKQANVLGAAGALLVHRNGPNDATCDAPLILSEAPTPGSNEVETPTTGSVASCGSAGDAPQENTVCAAVKALTTAAA